MKGTRRTEARIMGILRQMESGAPVSGLCREHGMGSASVCGWRAGHGRGEPAAEAHRCRCRHAERSAEDGPRKEVTRPAQRRELAVKAMAMQGAGIALA